MKEIRWNLEKNAILKKTRGVTFEELMESRFLGIERHRGRENQDLMVFEYKQYAWVIPYVEEGNVFFLKTAFPSRKHTRDYLGDV